MMDVADKIAIVGGTYLIATGVGFVVSPKFFQRMTQMGNKSDPVLINLSGAVHFIIGMIVLVNIVPWKTIDQIAVSILGGLAVLKGCALIIVPNLTLKAGEQSIQALRMMAVGFIGYGIFLFSLGLDVF